MNRGYACPHSIRLTLTLYLVPSLARFLRSYADVMRLLLSLLSDGLPCLSENTAFEDPEGPGVDRLVKAFAAAVKAVGAVAECHRLAALEQSSGGTWAGNGGEEDGAGFSMLLCEALSLVTAAVSMDVAPLVEKGSGDATVRAEVITFFVVFFGGRGKLRRTRSSYCAVFFV